MSRCSRRSGSGRPADRRPSKPHGRCVPDALALHSAGAGARGTLAADQEKSELLERLRTQAEAFERQACEDALTGLLPGAAAGDGAALYRRIQERLAEDNQWGGVEGLRVTVSAGATSLQPTDTSPERHAQLARPGVGQELTILQNSSAVRSVSYTAECASFGSHSKPAACTARASTVWP